MCIYTLYRKPTLCGKRSWVWDPGMTRTVGLFFDTVLTAGNAIKIKLEAPYTHWTIFVVLLHVIGHSGHRILKVCTRRCLVFERQMVIRCVTTSAAHPNLRLPTLLLLAFRHFYSSPSGTFTPLTKDVVNQCWNWNLHQRLRACAVNTARVVWLKGVCQGVLRCRVVLL